MDKEYMKLEHVTKVIHKNVILDDVCLTLEENKIYGIKGINGSGKTMLLRAMAGLIRVEGTVVIDRQKIQGNTFPKDIGILIELPGFLNEFSGKENLQLLGMIQSDIRDADIDEAIVSVGLDPKDKRPYGKYSLGMKERLGIAQAILKKPRLVLLDEPTNAIDRNSIKLLEELVFDLKKDGSTIVVTSHDVEFLETVCDKIYTMERGQIL